MASWVRGPGAGGWGPGASVGGPGPGRGLTLVEVAVATAILTVIAIMGIGLLRSGTLASTQAVVDQDAGLAAGRLITTLSNELSDATASSVVIAPGRPEEITFRRVIAYDERGTTDSSKLVLTEPIRFRRVAMGPPGRYAVERVEGANTRRIAAYIADRDASDAALPGLTFALRSVGGTTVVDIGVTISMPGGPAGERVIRMTTSVFLEIN